VTTAPPWRRAGRPADDDDPLAPDVWLLPRQVAKLFGVRVEAVSRWADQGKLPCVRTVGGHRRYAKADVLELAAQYISDWEGGESE
jgi:excisionase family DNA binding protein